MYSRFHGFTIYLISIHSSSRDELISWTTIYESQRYTTAKDLCNAFSIDSRDRYWIGSLNMWAIFSDKCLSESPRQSLCEDIGDEFLRMILELFSEKNIPFEYSHISDRGEI